MPAADAALAARLAALAPSNRAFADRYGGAAPARAPVHVVYGGAHLFSAETPAKVGALARAALDTYAPTPDALAATFGLEPALAARIHAKVAAKLADEPVEDYRVDFEDGYGVRADADEDADAAKVGAALALARREGRLPPFSGVRIKSLHEETKARAARTLAIVLEHLGEPPPGFVITLPKVTHPEQVAALAGMLGDLEGAFGLSAGSLRLELMIEHVAAIVGPDGAVAAPRLVAAAGGRCVAVHFGTYDYTASAGITAAWQRPDHVACDVARALLQAALAGTGVRLADGATTELPVAPHKGALTDAQRAENAAVVTRAWRLHHDVVSRSLAHGFYQSWDLHPAQLVPRYVATYAFFLASLGPLAARLKNFLDAAARATRVGAQFDDAATGQGLLETFLRGRACGAFGPEELAAAGLSDADLGTRSFAALVARRADAGPTRPGG